MQEICSNLYVGGQIDFEKNKDMMKSWLVVHACKEPYHRNALGYSTRGAPKEHPNYLYLYDRFNHLILNIVDCDNPNFFSDDMINECLKYIISGIEKKQKVLIHCNQGESRAPMIALLAMHRLNLTNDDFDIAFSEFKNVYVQLNPKKGIFEYIKRRWKE